MNQQIKRSKIVQLITGAAGAAGTSAINGSIIDFASFEGALIIAQFGPIVATAVTSIKFQHGDAADLSDAADVAGTNQTVAVADANTIKYIDLRRPVKRYGRLVVSRATANATVMATAIQYGARSAPVTQPSDVVGEVFVSPDAGTA